MSGRRGVAIAALVLPALLLGGHLAGRAAVTSEAEATGAEQAAYEEARALAFAAAGERASEEASGAGAGIGRARGAQMGASFGEAAAAAFASAGTAHREGGDLAVDPVAEIEVGGVLIDESFYLEAWQLLPEHEKAWSRRVGWCESGNRPGLHGGPGNEYHGAFMFLLSSWENAPLSPGGDPHQYSWRTQAVVAVALKQQLGTKPWPVCG